MTQDQAGQAQDTEYAAEDETDMTQSGPVTRLKKVASAFRGDRGDQPVSDHTVPDEPVMDQAAPGPAGDSMMAADETYQAEHADATRPNEVGAVHGEELERDPASAGDLNTADPSVPGSARNMTTATTGTGDTRPATEYRNQVGTAAGYGGQASTEPEAASVPGTTPEYGSPARTGSSYGNAAGTATGYNGAADTATDAAGRHAAMGAQDETMGAQDRAMGAPDGLRPGEATERLGDFGDIAFGNLLPDAEQYTAQWQQVQFRFVDDPQGSVTEAAEIISQVTTRLEDAIRERQRAIEERQRAIEERASALRGRWGEGTNADTETLRETLRMYRAFMDQLVGTGQ